MLFVRNDGLVLELYGLPEQACGKSGAINRLALETDDINAAYASAKARELLPEGETVHSMPVFQNGVRFFTIEGPTVKKSSSTKDFSAQAHRPARPGRACASSGVIFTACDGRRERRTC